MCIHGSAHMRACVCMHVYMHGCSHACIYGRTHVYTDGGAHIYTQGSIRSIGGHNPPHGIGMYHRGRADTALYRFRIGITCGHVSSTDVLLKYLAESFLRAHSTCLHTSASICRWRQLSACLCTWRYKCLYIFLYTRPYTRLHTCLHAHQVRSFSASAATTQRMVSARSSRAL